MKYFPDTKIFFLSKKYSIVLCQIQGNEGNGRNCKECQQIIVDKRRRYYQANVKAAAAKWKSKHCVSDYFPFSKPKVVPLVSNAAHTTKNWQTNLFFLIGMWFLL